MMVSNRNLRTSKGPPFSGSMFVLGGTPPEVVENSAFQKGDGKMMPDVFVTFGCVYVCMYIYI